MTDNISYAGEIIVEDISIWTSDLKKGISIYGLFKEINIFEDIYSASMHGTILIDDGFNLKSNFPIIGEEIITLTCKTPAIPTSISKTFNVTGITDFTVAGSKKQLYLLNIVSCETKKNMYTKIYESYDGLISDSVVKVFSNYFPNTKIEIDITDNSIKLTSSSLSPFECLNTLAAKAMTAGDIPNFLFYEDNQKFNFKSLSSLFAQQPAAVYKWSYDKMRLEDSIGQSTRDIIGEFLNVKDMKIKTLFHEISKMMSGSYGHKVYSVDLFDKSFSVLTHSYQNDFSKTNHLNSYPVNTSAMNFNGNENAVVDVSIGMSQHHDNYKHDKDGIRKTKRNPILHEASYVTLELTTQGNTGVKVGDVIYFLMGKFQTSDVISAAGDTHLDPYYSGAYLISAIQHRITQTKHEMIMEVIKDSFPTQITIPSASKTI
jgi:hypothetical protein